VKRLAHYADHALLGVLVFASGYVYARLHIYHHEMTR
jgi:hypothetical protein